MKYYLTKWALTRGIVDGDGDPTECGGYVSGQEPGGLRFFVPVRDAHTDIDQAILRHRELVQAAIKTTKARLAKLLKEEKALDAQVSKMGGRP